MIIIIIIIIIIITPANSIVNALIVHFRPLTWLYFSSLPILDLQWFTIYFSSSTSDQTANLGNFKGKQNNPILAYPINLFVALAS